MAEFVYAPVDRRALAVELADSIRDRIRSGRDANDAPMKPLSRRYARYKVRRGLKPLRDWTKSGRTLGALTVLGGGDSPRIGFSDPVAASRAAANDAIQKAFAVSPANRAELKTASVAAFREAVTVR